MLYFLGSRWVCTTIFSSFFVFTIRGKKNLNPKFYPCNKKWVIPLRYRLLVTTFASPKENTFNPMHLGPIGAIDHCISRIFTNFSLISNQNLPIKLTKTCNFSVGLWVYSLISSSFLYIYMCVCVCVSQIKKEILSVVKSSHIGKVWYWEGIYHLFHDTNGHMQFWWWPVSVFPYLIPLLLYIYVCVCVCVCFSNKIK